MKPVFVLTFVSLALVQSTSAQSRERAPQLEPGANLLPKLFHYEAVNRPSETPGHSRMDICYRIDLSFFVAVRTESPETEFVRKGDVLVELIDSLGVSRARDMDIISVETESGESVPAGQQWQDGLMSFSLPPGLYTLVFSVEDRKSTRQMIERKRTVRTRDFPSDSLFVTHPFLISLPDFSGAPPEIHPQNFGGAARFGSRTACVVCIGNIPEADSLRIDCSFTSSDSLYQWSSREPTSQDARIFRGFRLSPGNSAGRPSYILESSQESEAVAILPLPLEKFPIDGYSLRISATAGASRSMQTLQFAITWPDMPRSLRDPVSALNKMRYITTEDELDSLEQGKEKERRAKFEHYWALRDQTPETAYNEVMAEYYSRVDEATTRFSTLRQPEGWKTDRGRIYILYGDPTNTERKLDPDGYKEIWSYQKAGKLFVFVDRSRTGDYVLNSVQ